MTHDAIVAIATLGVVGQVFAGAVILAGIAALVGLRAPLEALRRLLWGYELWAAFVVSAVGTAGSLFFSEVAGFIPCELCWYERICTYPLSIITLLAAIAGDYRIARYVIALPLVGSCVSVYHLLVENGVVTESSSCLLSAPGGCATKWINEFGYMTIPTLSLTGSVLLIELLGLAAWGAEASDATLTSDA